MTTDGIDDDRSAWYATRMCDGRIGGITAHLDTELPARVLP